MYMLLQTGTKNLRDSCGHHTTGKRLVIQIMPENDLVQMTIAPAQTILCRWHYRVNGATFPAVAEWKNSNL